MHLLPDCYRTGRHRAGNGVLPGNVGSRHQTVPYGPDASWAQTPFAKVWRDHELWREQSGDDLMADFMNNSPKYIVSDKPKDKLEWQPATLIKGDLAEELTKLKQQPGKNIQIPGSPTLVQSLLRDGLLDELRLNVCPIVAGSGMRLFDGITHQVRLKLVDSTTFSTGVLGATYQPANG